MNAFTISCKSLTSFRNFEELFESCMIVACSINCNTSSLVVFIGIILLLFFHGMYEEGPQ